MQKNKSVCIAFLGNALHDSRISNLSDSLRGDGCDVSVISFDWRTLRKNHISEKLKIFRLDRSNSLFFYTEFALKLLFNLFSVRADIFFAEDIYTLPFVWLIAKLKGAKVYYNSRELYAFIGGLTNKPALQSVIKSIEKFFIRRVDLVMTTGEMDSAFIEKFYGISDTVVIRNIPLHEKPGSKIDFRKMYGIPADAVILLYQGVLIGGRGITKILSAMKNITGTFLVLLGDGERKNEYKAFAEELGVGGRVFFAGTIGQKELINYTAGADIGLALIENISVSYYHALPNKLFEYIMAGLPVLSCDLPQMKKIVETYGVGESINIEEENSVEQTLAKMIGNPGAIENYKANCASAAKELNWQAEYERVKTRLIG